MAGRDKSDRDYQGFLNHKRKSDRDYEDFLDRRRRRNRNDEDFFMMQAATLAAVAVAAVAVATVAMTYIRKKRTADHADDDKEDDSTNAQHSSVSSLTGNADEYQGNHGHSEHRKRESKSVPTHVVARAPVITTNRGGGKVNRRSQVRRNERRDVPYAIQLPPPAMTKKAPKASVGEAENSK